VSHDTSRDSAKPIDPRSSVVQFRNSVAPGSPGGYSAAGGHGRTVYGVATPVAIAAAAVIGFIVEPGFFWACVGRKNNAPPSGFSAVRRVSDAYSFSVKPFSAILGL
jgi:hypothetical protein